MKLGRVVKSSLRLCVFSEGEFSAKTQGRRGAEETGADSVGVEGARRNTRNVEMRRGFTTKDTESTEGEGYAADDANGERFEPRMARIDTDDEEGFYHGGHGGHGGGMTDLFRAYAHASKCAHGKK